MAVEIVFATGTSLKVTAGLDEVRDAVAERVIVSGAAIAYAIEIPGS